MRQLRPEPLSVALSVALWLGSGAAARSAEAPAEPAPLARVEVDAFALDNGMTFLLVERPQATAVAAGWVAHVGSADDPPGRTGLAHFLEHLLFKGSRTIGTQDVERELPIIARQEEVQDEIRRLVLRQRRGGAAGAAAERAALEERFAELVAEQRPLLVPDELDRLYAGHGAVRMNAFTTPDLTAYFVSLPAEKLELWFWLESDRMLAPVFREFYAERQVVEAERRQLLSRPGGEHADLFGALFWQAHPYRWPRIGWPGDLEMISRADARSHFAAHYAPANLTAVLVGRFDRRRVRELAGRYFGRLPEGAGEPPEVSTLEPEQSAEKRMLARCDCPPQVEVRYHSAPFGHPDAHALDVLAGLLNGPSGRLHRSLVAGDGVAVSASAQQTSLRQGGFFKLEAEASQGVEPEELAEALDRELRRLGNGPVPEQELERVKNGLAADAYRRLEDPFYLMVRLLILAGQGDWRQINAGPAATLAVTAADVGRVARAYLGPENRTVGLYRRQAEAAPGGGTDGSGSASGSPER